MTPKIEVEKTWKKTRTAFKYNAKKEKKISDELLLIFGKYNKYEAGIIYF